MLSLFTGKRVLRKLAASAVVLLAVTLGASPALAGGHHSSYANRDHDHDPAANIYTGPGLKVTTASQIGGLSADSGVLLKGYIVSQVGPNQYMFRDSTGTSMVLMSEEDWNSLEAGPSNLVKIHGKAVPAGSGMAVQEERIATISN